MADISIVNPKTMGAPLSLYGQIARVRASEFVFISGQLATEDVYKRQVPWCGLAVIEEMSGVKTEANDPFMDLSLIHI